MLAQCFCWGVAKSVLELDNGDGCRTLGIYQKSWNCILKNIKFMVCEF